MLCGELQGAIEEAGSQKALHPTAMNMTSESVLAPSQEWD